MSDQNTPDYDPPRPPGDNPIFEKPKMDDGLRDPSDLATVALVIAVLAILCSLASLLLTVTT